MSYSDFTHDVMRALGYDYGRLPVEGMPVVRVLGVQVWIKPLSVRAPGESHHKRSNHRLMCVCPLCAWTGSLGRLKQHTCTHAEKNCWGCGDVLERSTDKPVRYGPHSYCDWHCVNRIDDGPTDFDEQDRRAAAEERISNIQQER